MSEIEDDQSFDPSANASYLRIRAGRIVGPQIRVNEDTILDLDEEGRLLGVESLDGTNVDWRAILHHPALRFVCGNEVDQGL